MPTSTWAWHPTPRTQRDGAMMSSFDANHFEHAIRLEYRSAPTPIYVDPVAERLAVAGTMLAAAAWLIYWGIELFPASNSLLLLSLFLGVAACICTVGAMLERHIPPWAWLAATCLSLYWLMIAGVWVRTVYTTIMAQ